MIVDCLGLFNATQLNAQEVELSTLVKYTQDQGLSSYNIRKIIQDKYQFIWVATQEGLNRFDGQSFVNYNKNLAPERRLLGADVRGMIEDPAHDLLWILTDQGIDKINTVTSNVDVEHAFRNTTYGGWNMSMTKIDDEIWIGTFNGIQLYNTKNGQSHFISNHSGQNTLNEVRNIFTDEKNNVWACVSGVGIKIFNPKTRQLIKLIPNSDFLPALPGSDIVYWNSINIRKNTILFATSAGLREVSYDEHYSITINNAPSKHLLSLNTDNILYISKDRKGFIYVSDGIGFYRFNPELSKYVKVSDQSVGKDGEWLNGVLCSFSDRYNDLWIGCKAGLAFMRGDKPPFRSFYNDPRSGLKLEHVLSISAAAGNKIYAGLQNGLIAVDLKSFQFKKLNETQAFQYNYVDPFGRLQASYQNGISVYKNRAWLPIASVYPEFEQFANCNINSHLNIGDSLVVLGTDNGKGLLIWNYRKRIVNNINMATKPSLPSNIVNALYLDKKNNLWALSDNHITIITGNFSKSRFLSFYDRQNKQPYNIYFDMCEARKNYWIAAYGTGIIQLGADLKIKRVYTTRDGLSNAGVYQIFAVGDSSVVITSNNGLSVLNLASGKFHNYYEHDGLHSNSFEQACAFMKDGMIYAGGVKGFSVIDPSRLKINTVAPALYLNRVVIEKFNGNTETSSLALKSISIPTNTLQTTLYFSGINYINPGRTLFAYRIVEQGTNWTTIGNRNFINLIGLSPDTYTVEVKAANEDNYWSKPMSITLVYLPKWYQTWWFKGILAGAFLGICYILYRLRIRQILKEHKIRADIAGDLHDDIGSTLNSIKVFTNLAMVKPENTEYLENINKSLENAIVGLRDLIWVLDDDKDTVSDLINRLRQLMLPLVNAMNIELKLSMDDSSREKVLSKTEKRYLYFIVKEAINNSIKYSGCTQIKIEFNETQKLNSLIIQDNGKGFEISKRSEGYGLRNMQARATQINYELTIRSDLNIGTLIQVCKK